MTAEEIIEFIREMVAHQSNSNDDQAQRGLQSLIADRLTSIDQRLIVRRGPASDRPWVFICTNSSPKPMLVFACHVDTVPTGDPSLWTYPPLSGHIDGDRIFGRGVVDMKGGIAAAAASLLTASKTGKHVGLLLTADEEVGSLGAPGAAAALASRRIGAVIIPEATNNKIVLGHRGALWLHIRIEGHAAHGSTPDRGINAALKLSSVLLRAQNNLPLAEDSFLGRESWNPGIVMAGSAVNIVPDLAEAIIDMRVVTDGEALLKWWKEQPEIASVERVLHLPPLRTLDTPWLTSKMAEIADTPASYFTDGSAIAHALPGTPIVVWGPGAPDQMHARDESLELGALLEAVSLFKEAVETWS